MNGHHHKTARQSHIKDSITIAQHYNGSHFGIIQLSEIVHVHIHVHMIQGFPKLTKS